MDRYHPNDTTPPSSKNTNRHSSKDQRVNYLLDDPSEFIASLPAFVTMIPKGHVLFIGIRQDGEHDRAKFYNGMTLPLDTARRVISQIPNLLDDIRTDTVAVIIVDPRAVFPADPDDPPKYTDLINELREGFIGHDILLAGAWATTAFEESAPWWSLTDDIHGTLWDPADRQVQPIRVKSELLYTPHRETELLLKPDIIRARQTRLLFREMTDAIKMRIGAATIALSPSTVEDFINAEVTTITDVMINYDPAEHLTTEVAADIGARIGLHAAFRAVLRRITAPDTADSVGDFWADMTRSHVRAPRAHSAVAYAAFAYTRGNLPAARHAIETALRIDPECRIVRALRGAIRTGIPIEQLGRVLDALAADDFAD